MMMCMKYDKYEHRWREKLTEYRIMAHMQVEVEVLYIFFTLTYMLLHLTFIIYDWQVDNWLSSDISGEV